MKFGFLTDRTSFECDGFKITTASNFDDVLEKFYQSMHVSNGWFYGPEEQLKKSSAENDKFKERGPINCSSFFRIKPTHQISANGYDDNHLRFLVLGYGFLQGIYLTPEGYSYLGRTAYDPGKLNGLLLIGDDYINGMDSINRFYRSSSQENQSQMFASIHWYLVGQSYTFDWDRFDAQYKVLDGLYKLSGLKANNHASRPIVLAEKYGIELPSWAELDATGKQSKLSKQRNELVHEAKYGGHPIGYSYPDENYSLEFTSFNTKLIAAALGINTPYLAAEPTNREFWGWNIET
ncbi:MAG: hypothetical protein K9L22_12240 [Methylococcaceae bacterium]|nr:hypothetical protein [Methylococcaceae bacterium]